MDYTMLPVMVLDFHDSRLRLILRLQIMKQNANEKNKKEQIGLQELVNRHVRLGSSQTSVFD